MARRVMLGYVDSESTLPTFCQEMDVAVGIAPPGGPLQEKWPNVGFTPLWPQNKHGVMLIIFFMTNLQISAHLLPRMI